MKNIIIVFGLICISGVVLQGCGKTSKSVPEMTASQEAALSKINGRTAVNNSQK